MKGVGVLQSGRIRAIYGELRCGFKCATAFLLVCAALSYALVLSGCAGSAAADDEVALGKQPTGFIAATMREAESYIEGSKAQEVVCWGDSMTYGVGADVAYIITAVDTYDASFKSYPEILAHLTNLNVCNLGYPAATSEEIMAKQEGKIAKEQSAEESALDQRLVEHGVKNATRNGAQDVLVIEIGSNGGWDGDYDTLVAQYRTMIDRSGCSNFLVLGDTDDPGTSEGDVNQGPLYDTGAFSETQWETALREAFGDHFVNVRQYLIVNGLNVTGIKPSEEDVERAQLGCISEQLRSDWTHLNSYGYYAKARAVYERGIDLGYWS